MTREHEAIRKLILPIFDGARGGPYTVYLYGSRATGRARSDSDYDFALIAPAPLERAELVDFRQALADSLCSDEGADCVDMRRIPLTLAAQVLESGLVLIPGDEERARETRDQADVDVRGPGRGEAGEYSRI